MRSATLVLAAVLAASAAPTAAQEFDRSYPTVVDAGLTFVRGPSVRDMNRFYRTTRHDGLRGVARVWCISDAEGRPSCEVIDEEPSDRQFGLAGVRVMERTRVATADGSSPEGRGFSFTLRFGNWSSRSLPDNFQPIRQNLIWVERPTLVGSWNMQGMDRGDRVSASFDCSAQADGALTCSLVSADNAAFGEAALNSMQRARVERSDGGVLEGTPLRWTLAMERQSGCGTSGGRGGAYPGLSTGTGPDVTSSINPNEGGAPTSSVEVGQTPNSTGGGMPGCQSAMVQVFDANQ